jgi:hypothetical protein
MSNFLVPIQTINIVSSGSGTTKPGRSRNIIQIRDVKLAFGSACRNKIRVFRIELKSFNGAAVLPCARDQAGTVSCQQRIGVPQVQRTVVQCASNYASFRPGAKVGPSEIIEAAQRLSATL